VTVSEQELTLFDIDPIARRSSVRLPARRPRRRTESQRVATTAHTDLGGQRQEPEVVQGRTSRQVQQQQLPPTLDVVTAGAILGVGRTVAYRLVRQGRWPTHVVRVGRKVVIPTLPLLEFLGIQACDVPNVLTVSTGSRNGLDPLVAEGAALPRPVSGR
jgi:hypothetical protein